MSAATTTSTGKGALTAAAVVRQKALNQGRAEGYGATIGLLGPPPPALVRRALPRPPPAGAPCPLTLGMARLPGAVLQMIEEAKYDLQMPSPSPTLSPASERRPPPTLPSRTPAQHSTDGYSDALRRLAITVRRQPGASTRECMQDHMPGIVRTTESDGGLKRVLTAVRVLEKFRWI